MRVTAFIDGFNLYHAVDKMGANYLKWLNLRAVAQMFTPLPQYELREVLYFSAFAKWRKDSYKRHREYVKALRATDVTPVMGNFKEKYRWCKCGKTWKDHEEKETDVNIALHLLRGAYEDTYDLALILSADSDLVPAIRMIREPKLSRQVKLITPSNHTNCNQLIDAAGGPKFHKPLQVVHVERALFPKDIMDSQGNVLATRPIEWAPSAPPPVP